MYSPLHSAQHVVIRNAYYTPVSTLVEDGQLEQWPSDWSILLISILNISIRPILTENYTAITIINMRYVSICISVRNAICGFWEESHLYEPDTVATFVSIPKIRSCTCTS